MTKNVVIVDDNKRILGELKTILEANDYSVRDFFDPSLALQSITEDYPSYVVLDVVMPDQSGLELCRKIRDLDQEQKIKIIMYSGELTDLKGHFNAFGANACLLKSDTHKELLNLLQELSGP